jgi:hypothetical protein
MGTMLPAGFTGKRSLADVMPSCLSALRGAPNALALPSVDRIVVVLVDGLGAHALRARSGHARFLSSRLTRSQTMASGFPTTTAAALATLCTGTTPGEHGMVGYRVLDPETDRVFNQLSGWADGPDPSIWQRMPTVFETAVAGGITASAIGPERYRDSPFTRAVLRGARYLSAKTIEQRVDAALGVLGEPVPSLSYLYVPELDMTAHARGWESDEWLAALEEVDGQISRLERGLPAGSGVIVTADHGVLDVPESGHVLFDTVEQLVADVRHIGGEPRCLQLYLENDAQTDAVERLAGIWREVEGARSWIATRDEAISAGWFGPKVDDAVRDRIGHVLVAARGRIAYYDSRGANQSGRAMVGQHGSLSPEESSVPIIGLGAFEGQRPN